jgi:RNA polymerase sigma-70 factor (ECF subfamily)
MSAASHDDDLIRRAKMGEQTAWRELYVAHASRLAVWLRSLPTGDAAADHEDVAAAAWMAAARRIADFTGNTSDFAGWLFSIARNVAMNTRSRSVRRATVPTAADGPDSDIWGLRPDWSTGVDESDWARSLLTHLPPREAEVVACVDVVGLDVATTARVLDISESAVRVSRHRGLRRLRTLIADRPERDKP